MTSTSTIIIRASVAGGCKSAYLSHFIFSDLVSVAGHCARSGVRVVSASTFSARYCLHKCLGTVYLALVLQVVQRVAVKLVRY